MMSKKDFGIILKIVDLWSILKVFTRIEKKNQKKIFFYVGENLCFTILKFLEAIL